MNTLPEPLTPEECDIHDLLPPRSMFVRLMVETFGLSVSEAETEVDRIAGELGLEMGGTLQ